MKGVYLSSQGKYSARTSRKGKSIHLGSFDNKEDAMRVYDATCLVFGKSINSYNYPHEVISLGMLQKVLTTLREKEVITLDDLMAITNRDTILFGLAEKLVEIDNDNKET